MEAGKQTTEVFEVSSASVPLSGTIANQPSTDLNASANEQPPAYGRMLTRLMNSVERQQIAMAKFLGCNLTELQVLTRLEVTGPMTLSEIAAATGMRSSVITGIADRLEVKGLATRARDSADRRRRRLMLQGQRLSDLRLAYDVTAQITDIPTTGQQIDLSQLLWAIERAGMAMDLATAHLEAHQSTDQPRRVR